MSIASSFFLEARNKNLARITLQRKEQTTSQVTVNNTTPDKAPKVLLMKVLTYFCNSPSLYSAKTGINAWLNAPSVQSSENTWYFHDYNKRLKATPAPKSPVITMSRINPRILKQMSKRKPKTTAQ